MREDEIMDICQRFWCPLGGSYSLADDGFLVNPEGKYSTIYQPDVVAYADLSHLPCLALLGEPGIGKSTAVRSLVTTLTTECLNSGEDSLEFDLREYGSEDRLERHIVEADQIARWSRGDGVLHLVFDSLDECRIRIPNVSSLLLRFLRDNCDALPRLRLRIACRTADWPSQLTRGLHELWEAKEYAAYELLPLRRQDIAGAARAEGLDENDFINAVRRAGAQPLAIKPITLRFLIDSFKSGGGLPATQTELYEHGCRHLCTETSISRRDAGHLGSLDPDQRITVASRIAALMTLCRKPTIAIDPLVAVRSPDILSLASATGGTETVKGNQLEITEAELKEVLATGLFSGREPGMLGFAHQTYAEYLTARYVAMHDLDLEQITSLICHPGDINRPVVPQLSELTGWLASMSRPLFQRILAIDPVVLLRSDAATSDNKDRAALLAGVLKQLEHIEVSDHDWSLRERCARFTHPDLADQLRPYIVDKKKDTIVRRVSIDIAEAAKVSELQDPLVAVALDSTDEHQIRDQAAHAIADYGEDTQRRRLMPLLASDEADDPDDQLRGCAMKALWSKRLISLDKLLDAIQAPRRPSFMGSYEHFLAQDFTSQLTLDEVPRVLDWLCNHRENVREDFSYGLTRLSDSVISKALDCIHHESTRVSLATYALNRLEARDSVFSDLADHEEQEKLWDDHELRHTLVTEIVQQMDDNERDAALLVWSRSSLVKHEDLQWLLSQAVDASVAEIAQRYSHLARFVFNLKSAEDIGMILDAVKRSPDVQAVFERYFKPIVLASAEARDLKEKHEKYRDMPSRGKKPTPPDPPMTDQVKAWLDRCEAGETGAWWRLNHCMLFEQSGLAGALTDREDDLRDLPGWTDADLETRRRIVSAAEPSLYSDEPMTDEWLARNVRFRPAWAGYRALVLLANERPQSLQAIPEEIWAKWAAIVLDFPISVDRECNEYPALDLVTFAYSKAPEATIDALSTIVDTENGRDGLENLPILRKLRNCWDARLCRAMLDRTKDLKLKPGCVGDLLRELLEHGCEGAAACAKSLIGPPVSTEHTKREMAREAAIALMKHTSDAGWSTVWAACAADREFGRSLFEAIAWPEKREGTLIGRLSDADAAELYVWLSQEYPHSEDPSTDEGHSVDARKMVGHFRDSILQALERRGTHDSVAAIKKIVEALPTLSWLRYTLVSAKDRMLRQSWLPPQPDEVLKLCANPLSRLVRTASELQDLLVEVLGDITQDLQGETPAAPEVWNIPTHKTDPTPRRPKEENRLSDWLKRELEAKLSGHSIVLLREVEIRRGEGTGSTKKLGERTDIHVIQKVSGASEGVFDTIRVIIEVKGCWHPELQTAMKDQLVDRYLTDNACQHGIYVVGWYMCDHWDAADSRKIKTPKWTIEKAKKEFEGQANKLSCGTKRIRAVVLNTSLR